MSNRRSPNASTVLSRAKRGTCFFLFQRAFICLTLVFVCVQVGAQRVPQRPRVLGIAGVSFYSSNFDATRDFYGRILNMTPGDVCFWCEVPVHGQPRQLLSVVLVSAKQRLTLAKPPVPTPPNLLYEIIFETDDLKAMKTYLEINHIVANKIVDTKAPNPIITVVDPEGHLVAFTQRTKAPPPADTSTLHIIHAGFVVHNRETEDKFYKDILGFHVYWHGGMKDDETHWVDMQVPDGTDWIEYMLNVPVNADHHTLGVMNHIALGVPDIHAAEAQLRKNGWTGTEQPKIGRDGKWQLNLYDPDDTRVELMEFTPTQKPCCSEYTGPHPKP
jgi:catechol 2,3-dioxygenase-like lactoylglutathione lyase family enzyme